jgi:phycocyanobilin:ferredoxin oxidoreductase
MSTVWQSLDNLTTHIVNTMDSIALRANDESVKDLNRPEWQDYVWINSSFRRAHLNVVDSRNTKGIMMMHFCIFPYYDSDAPIFGCDIVAGKNKITGFFHDYSPTINPKHTMIDEFSAFSHSFKWSKVRSLPDWAVNIFSPNIIAAGNITDQTEIDMVYQIASTTMEFYLKCIDQYVENSDVKCVEAKQNRYVQQQKKNPQLYSSLKSMGLDSEQVELFVNKTLFPESEIYNHC